MPRSVIVLSSDPELFDKVRAVLRTDRRFSDTGDSLHCDGGEAPHTNVYPVVMNASEWAGWGPESSEIPDPRTMSTLIFECRSNEWVAEVGRLIADALDTPVWFVDSSDVAWPAQQVDEAMITLA